MQPIWKDYYVTLGTGESVEYTIRNSGGNIIYSGKAYKRPDVFSIRVKINDICANYLYQTFPDIRSEGIENPDGLAEEFTVNDAQGNVIDTVVFAYDWSYDYDREVVNVASSPISPIIAPNQPIIYTQFNAPSVDVRIELADGTVEMVNYPSGGVSANVVVLLKDYPTAKSVRINGLTYTVGQMCAENILYYVNEFGGWDSFIIEGATNRQDNYSRNEYKQVYDNSRPQNRGTFNYLNEITRQYTFNTGWLSDEQSLKMRHIFSSPLVYMYNLATMQFVPLVLTDNSYEYKTYKQQGRRLVRYTIKANEAKTIIRR